MWLRNTYHILHVLKDAIIGDNFRRVHLSPVLADETEASKAQYAQSKAVYDVHSDWSKSVIRLSLGVAFGPQFILHKPPLTSE